MEIGSLRAVLDMDSSGFAAGVSAAQGASRRLQGEFSATALAAQRAGSAVDRSFNQATGVTSNLGAQFMDIGQMLASGQSPLLLAVQQGSQISQVLGPMGARGAVAALRGAFVSLLNPVTAVTIGSIAVGATLLQWLTDSGEEAQTLEQRIDGLGEATDRYTGAMDAARVPLAELRREWGEYADEKLADLREMAEIEGRNVQREAISVIEGLTEEFGSGNTRVGLLRDLFDFGSMDIELRHAQEEMVAGVIRSLNQMEAATTGSLDDQIAAYERYYAAVRTAAMASGSVSGREEAKLFDARQVLDYLKEVRRGRDEEARLADEAAERATRAWGEYYQSRIVGEVMVERAAVSLEDRLADMRDRMAEMAGTDLAGPFERAWESVDRLVGRLDQGMGILGRWGGAIGDFVAGFAPGEMGQQLEGMTDGLRAAMVLLKEFEGFQPVGTWDVNAYRAGYGSDTVTLADGSIQAITQGMQVNRADAERDLERRTRDFASVAMREIGADRWGQLLTSQQAVLTSLAYNYGNLPDAVAQAVRSGASDMAVGGVIRDLGFDNGGVNQNRRNQEAAIYAAGVGAVADAQFRAASASRAAEEATREADQARQDAARSAAEQVRLTEAAAAAFDGLVASYDPAAASAQQFAEAQAVVNDAVARGIISATEGAAAMEAFGRYQIENSEAGQLARQAQEDAAGAAEQAAADFEGVWQGAIDSVVDWMGDGFEGGFDRLLDIGKSVLDDLIAYYRANPVPVQAEGGGGIGGVLGGPMGGLIGAGVGLIASLFGRRRRQRQEEEARERQEEEAMYAERLGLQYEFLRLTGRTNELRRMELEAIDPLNRHWQRRVWQLQDEAEAAAEVARVNDERRGIQDRLLELEGNTAALRRRELMTLDVGNRALMERYYILLDAAAAEEKAAETAARIADERRSIVTRLLEMEGDTLALRRRELMALDPANRALMERLYLLEDEARVAAERRPLMTRLLELEGDTLAVRRRELMALEPANRAIQERIWALEREEEVASEREGLEERLLELQGNVAELRRRELATLDRSNRSLQIMIWGLEDAKAAMDALDMSDFASRFDFERTRGLVANRTSAPASLGGVPLATVPNAAPVAVASDPQLLAEVKGLREEQKQLQLKIERSLHTLAAFARKDDTIGTPPVRAA